MEDNVYQAALAGLLHDIGKMAARAGERGTRTWDEQARQDFGHYHALLTSDFVERYLPPAWKSPVKLAAANHHRPQSRLDLAVSLADVLSAGERADLDSEERAAQPRQLLSIFCSLEAEGARTPQDVYWPLGRLRLDEEQALFPGPALPDEKVWDVYTGLWQGLTGEAERLRAAYENARDEDSGSYLESLLLLLQRFTWSVPAAYYKNLPDISLYDHARMTAALAAILNDSPLGNEELAALRQAPEADGREVALLVGGDLSGVQDFIYTISSRGATSALRGRSFYLQLLTEAALRFLMRRLGLPLTNLIYAGGGNFYLLARPQDAEMLAAAQAEISRTLLYHHAGDLYLALGCLPLAPADFFHGRLSGRWGELHHVIQAAKTRRFTELGADLAYLVRPQGHGGNQDRQCQVCGLEHPLTKGVETDPETGEGVRKCPPCRSYEALGKDLRLAHFLSLEEKEPAIPALAGEPVPGDYRAVLDALGWKASIHEEIPPAHERSRRIVFALDDEASSRLRPDPNTAVGRRLLVNVTPLASAEEAFTYNKEKSISAGSPGALKKDDVKPFDMLEAQSSGIPRLGVLRMDVDNLGRLFAEGLGAKATLSRMASLSFAVSLFFEGWVETLAGRMSEKDRKADPQRGERLYSIYSGGDDLFFVGSWDAVVELGIAIRHDLARYAAGHPGIHASAGIALVGGKYPLSQAAGDASQAEERAKRLRWWDDDRKEERRKDAVCFLGQTLPWPRFGLGACGETSAKTAHALMHFLVEAVEKEGARRALLRRLIGLHEQYEEALQRRRERGRDQNRLGQEQALFGPWNWMAMYLLRRMEKQAERSAQASIANLREQLKSDDFRSIEWIGLAARWAELRLRNS